MTMAQMKVKSSEPAPAFANHKRHAKLAQTLLVNSLYTLQQWLPGGRQEGDEYVAPNPTRSDHHAGSFKINTKTGQWADFATYDKGGNLVQLYRYLSAIEQPDQLISSLEQFCSEHGLTAEQPLRPTQRAQQKPATETIPADAMKLLPPDSDLDGNPVVGCWEYRTLDNEVLFYVLRTEPEPGKKETKPCRLSGGKWAWSNPGGPLPLYNGYLLKKGDTVLFGEGEKTADALTALGVGIGMTSAGGSNRLLGSDLSVLKKAGKVVIFPDADAPGSKYATQVLWYGLAINIECQVLDVDALGWCNGEDVADHPELSWDDYEPQLLAPDQWLTNHTDFSDEALFDVLGHISQAEYDRCLDRIAKLSKLAKKTLNDERKTRVKEMAVKAMAEPEMDISDIDLPLAVKEAKRLSLAPSIQGLTQSPDLLEQIVQACQQTLGVYNERELIKLGYLCVVSRLLEGASDRPVSLMLKGSSGSGKSHVIKQVLRLFRPNDTWIMMSSISPKGLIYDQRSYRGKVLFLPECNQLVDQDSLLTQLVKTILTEGAITHLTVDTGESASPEGKVIVKEGPIVLILGTIRDYLDAEMETRALSYYVDESAEHTRHIVLQAADRMANAEHQDQGQIDAVLTPWLMLDEWLALSPIRKVVIPFYRQIVERVEHMPVRYRRDLVEMLPGLIKASALLHQAQREVIDGVIQATLEDYNNVRPMVDDFLHRMQGDDVTPNQNRLLKLIYGQMSPEVRAGRCSLTISQSELAKVLGITQQAVGYQLNKLVEKGCLKNTQMLPKKPARLQLGPEFKEAQLSQTSSVLPTLDLLDAA